jgi:ArsR family transcriptional regulator, arsenate/arsenite/antimonite-responsive transcriptional repressor
MDEQTDLTYMANLYMALADKTRLRLLNLMREQEVCVGYFTDVLGDSQPKISRHLAYLRNAGIVEARRDGKWMHYSIRRPEDPGIWAVVDTTLRSLTGQEICRLDSQRYFQAFGGGSNPQPESHTYAYSDMSESVDHADSRSSSHNELEEFLL